MNIAFELLVAFLKAYQLVCRPDDQTLSPKEKKEEAHSALNELWLIVIKGPVKGMQHLDWSQKIEHLELASPEFWRAAEAIYAEMAASVLERTSVFAPEAAV